MTAVLFHRLQRARTAVPDGLSNADHFFIEAASADWCGQLLSNLTRQLSTQKLFLIHRRSADRERKQSDEISMTKIFLPLET